jgi:chaperonin GroEL (HSP60 family)
MKSLEKPQAKTVNIIINLKDIAEVTETEKELEDALNSVKNYKNMLFGGCNDN